MTRDAGRARCAYTPPIRATQSQEREPTSKARAEVAEVWGWLKRKGLF